MAGYAAHHDVSIHAPARGATSDLEPGRITSTGFDPRPCARGDMRQRRWLSSTIVFRSTPLREGRRNWRGSISVRYQVSIHAPARGATEYRSKDAFGFDPRPCARGDISALRKRSDDSFDPRPCARGDRGVYSRRIYSRRFNPRPCARGDQLRGSISVTPRQVSIHAPARGATPMC